MSFWKQVKIAILAAMAGLVLTTTATRAEVNEIRISKGFGIICR